eukprot:1255121-Rhodomonas_salina.1
MPVPDRHRTTEVVLHLAFHVSTGHAQRVRRMIAEMAGTSDVDDELRVRGPELLHTAYPRSVPDSA